MKTVALVLFAAAMTLIVVGCAAFHFGKIGGDWLLYCLLVVTSADAAFHFGKIGGDW